MTYQPNKSCEFCAHDDNGEPTEACDSCFQGHTNFSPNLEAEIARLEESLRNIRECARRVDATPFQLDCLGVVWEMTTEEIGRLRQEASKTPKPQ